MIHANSRISKGEIQNREVILPSNLLLPPTKSLHNIIGGKFFGTAAIFIFADCGHMTGPR